MDFIYDTLMLYESAFLERVPFQLSLHLTGAIHSDRTYQLPQRLATFWMELSQVALLFVGRH